MCKAPWGPFRQRSQTPFLGRRMRDRERWDDGWVTEVSEPEPVRGLKRHAAQASDRKNDLEKTEKYAIVPPF